MTTMRKADMTNLDWQRYADASADHVPTTIAGTLYTLPRPVPLPLQVLRAYVARKIAADPSAAIVCIPPTTDEES
jgi:hypothetical protein